MNKNDIISLFMLVATIGFKVLAPQPINNILCIITFGFIAYITHIDYSSRKVISIEYPLAGLALVCVALAAYMQGMLGTIFFFFAAYLGIRFVLSVIYKSNKHIEEQNVELSIANDKLTEKENEYKVLNNRLDKLDEKLANSNETIKEMIFEVISKNKTLSATEIEALIMAKLPTSTEISEEDIKRIVNSAVQENNANTENEYKILNNRLNKLDEKLANSNETIKEMIQEAISKNRSLSAEEIEALIMAKLPASAEISEEDVRRIVNSAVQENNANTEKRIRLMLSDLRTEIAANNVETVNSKIEELRSCLNSSQSTLFDAYIANIYAELEKTVENKIAKLDVSNNINDLENELSVLKTSVTSELNAKIEELEAKIKTIPQEQNKPVANQEIRELFNKALADCEEELDIISPWMNKFVVNDLLMDKFERKLIKGVVIKILYGIGNYESTPGKNGNRNDKTEDIAASLRKRYKKYPNFHIKRGNTHQKLFVCDEKFYVLSSFNILSFQGDYSKNDKDVRDESGEYSANVDLIREYRNQLFNF